ncbi:MAG TPA: glycosyltransferase [Blastocatellia bacterium]|nr:glycosyltransferase [Blastocatellia bacterium]
MMNPDLISIIIPCYNQSHFLGEAIESVFKQTYTHYEIIVVDDGSTDETASVAAGFGSVRCLIQKNRGLAAARNAGLEASRGSYIVFLDADDRLLPNALEDGIKSLNSHPECAFAYGHIRLISANGLPLPCPRQVGVEANHYLELLRHNYIWTAGAVIYCRGVFDFVTGFNSSVNASADFDLNARISRLFPVCCSDSVVLEYRRHDESMSRDFAEMLKSAVIARRLQWESVSGNRLYEEALQTGIRIVQEDYGEKLFNQARGFMRERKWSRAVSGLLTLLRYYPQGVVKHAFRKLQHVVPNTQN